MKKSFLFLSARIGGEGTQEDRVPVIFFYMDVGRGGW